MYKQILLLMAAIAGFANAQTFESRALLVNRGRSDLSQCTVEVVVDGAADVEIRGGFGLLRNLSGQPPQWRRFECTSIMPPNPADFRFEGVDGRAARQQLIRDPRNGGAAVVRIEDRDNGAEGYTFRLVWSGYSAPYYDSYRGGARPHLDEYHRDRDQWFRGRDWRSRFFDRIREDLDHATSGTYSYSGDRARLARTQMELDELQGKLSAGYYDEQELDEVIGALRVVLQANRLAPRDRSILADDLDRMQDFRVRHDQYGAR